MNPLDHAPEAPTPPDASPCFSTFSLSAPLIEGVRRAGFKNPTRIQELAIPAILAGGDVIAQAQTGSGKTVAYALPCLDTLAKGKGTQLLVLVPTRELALQVAGELNRFGRALGINVATAFGGEAASRQLPQLLRGAEAVVATPGRLLDYLSSRRLPRFAPTTLILDEADEMLDMGFLDDVRAIAEFLPQDRRTLLFSATMPQGVTRLANDITRNAVRIRDDQAEATPSAIEQTFYVVSERDRFEALIRLLEVEEPEKAIVFCRTRRDASDLAAELSQRGLSVRALHGDLDIDERRSVMQALRDGRLQIVVATDVAARGLDVQGLTHVFNFGLPMDLESYVHRIGRTGRAGRSGKALSLVHPADRQKLVAIARVTDGQIKPATIPSRAEQKQRIAAKLARSIESIEPSDEARAIVAQLLAGDDDADEIVARLAEFALRRGDITQANEGQSLGNDRRLGMSLSEIDRWRAGPQHGRFRRNGPPPRRFGGARRH